MGRKPARGDSLAVDPDDQWRGEMELEVVSQVPRPAVALRREERLPLSVPDQICPHPALPSGSREGIREAGREDSHGKRETLRVTDVSHTSSYLILVTSLDK